LKNFINELLTTTTASAWVSDTASKGIGTTEKAPNDILSNLFLEDLEKIWELKKWIPDPCNPHLHYLKQQDDDEE